MSEFVMGPKLGFAEKRDSDKIDIERHPGIWRLLLQACLFFL